jgi:hypothetical protein
VDQDLRLERGQRHLQLATDENALNARADGAASRPKAQ